MIEYLELRKVTGLYSDEIDEAVRHVVHGGWYLNGEAKAGFEKAYSRYIGTEHCVGCANGLDALTLILRAYIELGVMEHGDEVIVPANTYIATILAITANGLVPVLVEPDADTFQIDGGMIECALTGRTRAVMIVHLYGKCAYTDEIKGICVRHGLKLIEDNAQAHGCVPTAVQEWENCMSGETVITANFHAVRTGALGDAAAHSFYPGKNLGALGDGGAVTTGDNELADMVRTLANYGSSVKYVFDYEGMNSRLDEVQAAVLSVKLRHLDHDNALRRRVARRYIEEVDNPLLRLPEPDFMKSNVFHIFPVLCERRDELQAWLRSEGIGTVIHYPVPPHKQRCYERMNGLSLPVTERIHREELSIPCNQVLTYNEVGMIIDALNAFK